MHCRSNCVAIEFVSISRQWLEAMRPVPIAMSQVLHLGQLMKVFCSFRFVGIVGSGLRRCVQSQVRSSR